MPDGFMALHGFIHVADVDVTAKMIPSYDTTRLLEEKVTQEGLLEFMFAQTRESFTVFSMYLRQ